MALTACNTCNAQMADTARACPNCGASNGSDKSGILALVLCFFLGGLGIHNFYLGRMGRGVFQLILAFLAIIPLLGLIPLGLLGLWLIFEFIGILIGTKDGDGQPVRL